MYMDVTNLSDQMWHKVFIFMYSKAAVVHLNMFP